MSLKLGKKAATYDKRDLTFAEFLKPAPLKAAPVGYGHAGLVGDYGMLGNDRYGDCVFAGAAHETMLWNAAAGKAVLFDASSVLSDYAAVTGFDPITGANDNGTDMHNAMTYRRKTGVIDATGKRHKIGAFLALEAGNWDEMLQALYMFEAIGIGVEFPNSAMDQFNAGKPWAVVRGATIEGGHYIPVVGRPRATQSDVLTWGRKQGMTKSFYHKYNDESYVILSEEMLTAGKSLEGFDLPALNAALKSL